MFYKPKITAFPLGNGTTKKVSGAASNGNGTMIGFNVDSDDEVDRII